MTNLSTSSITTNMIYIDLSNNPILLDYINVSNRTYYNYVEAVNPTLYQLDNMKLIPPFNLSNKITLTTNANDFILKNYNDKYYYKLNNEILNGIQLDNFMINQQGNFNLWIMPKSNLKLVDLQVNAYLSNGLLHFTSIINLPNYTYYYLNGYVYYIEIVTNPYRVTNYFITDISLNKLYFLAENNFDKVESQYISIFDTNSV